MSKDGLGDRMKDHENRTRYFLPRRIFGLLRIDGKAFHTYTKGLNKPFDEDLIADMNLTAKYLCENIQGARLGYVQSDEITILFTDYYDYKTELWFDGNIQKIVSVSASLATAKFNQLRIFRKAYDDMTKVKLAQFDSRVWSESLIDEVINCLIWRQQDAVRNSIQAVAQSLYSHKELNKKNSSQLQEMIFQKGINWNNLDAGKKRGRMIVKDKKLVPVTHGTGEGNVTRNFWRVENAIDFVKEKAELECLILFGL